MARRSGGGVRHGPRSASPGAAGRDVEAAQLSADMNAQEDPDLVRVGRWMSRNEYEAMSSTGIVQEGAGGTTYVAHPADPAAYRPQAASGACYVEFDVPRECLETASKPEWAQIPGPNSLTARYRKRQGQQPPQFPQALNIQMLVVKR